MKRIALHWQITIALVLGFVWAFVASSMGWMEATLDWIDPFGTVFLRLLKLIALPLVAVSVMRGVASLGNLRQLGQLGVRTLLLYLATTVAAVTIGLVMVNLIQPGTRADQAQRERNHASYEVWLSESSIKQPTEQPTAQPATETADKGPLQPVVDMIPDNIVGAFSSAAMLQIIAFAILMGIAMILLPTEATQPFATLLHSLDQIFLKLVDLVMKGAPFFVFCLVAGKVGGLAGNDPSRLLGVFETLGWYSITVILGLLLIIGVVYPVLVRLFRRDLSVRSFFTAMAPAQTLAFSSSSSAATLPVTLECVQDRLGVRQQTAGFVLPIGATINMDGTSMYQAVVVVFLAQFYMIDLSITQQLTIVLTASLASIGAAAVPSGGLVTLILVMQSVGLNPAWISFIVPMDRLLDMGRTVVNVTGDAAVCAVVDRWVE